MSTLSSNAQRLRIENEYKAICRLPIVSFYKLKIAPGEKPPYVRKYLVIYRNPYMVKTGSLVKKAREITVQFALPENYPYAPPEATIVSGDLPFLPNVYTSGRFCYGSMYKGSTMWLWEFMNNIGHVLAGDPRYTDINSPANADAAHYYSSHRSKFPTGRIDFPRPTA